MFDQDALDVFSKAGVKKEDAPDLFQQVKDILSTKMATLSVTMGMSYKRGEIYDEQKQALVDDLKQLKAKGEL